MIWYFLRNKFRWRNLLYFATIALVSVLTYATIDFIFAAAYDINDILLRYILSVVIFVLLLLISKYKPMKKLWVKDMNFDSFKQFYLNIPSAYFIVINDVTSSDKRVFVVNSFENIDKVNSMIDWLHQIPTNSTLLICGDNNKETLAIKQYVQCIINGFDEATFKTLYPETSQKLYNLMVALE